MGDTGDARSRATRGKPPGALRRDMGSVAHPPTFCRLLRRALDVFPSDRHAAEGVGLSPSTLSELCRGRRREMSYKTFCALSQLVWLSELSRGLRDARANAYQTANATANAAVRRFERTLHPPPAPPGRPGGLPIPWEAYVRAARAGSLPLLRDVLSAVHAARIDRGERITTPDALEREWPHGRPVLVEHRTWRALNCAPFVNQFAFSHAVPLGATAPPQVDVDERTFLVLVSSVARQRPPWRGSI